MTTSLRTHPPIPRATLASSQPHGQHPAHARVTVTQAFAKELNRSETWAHKALYHYPKLEDLVLASIRARRTAGDLMGLARFRLVIQREFAEQAGISLTRHLEVEASHKDGVEDATATAMACEHCEATARAEQRALRAEIEVKTRLLAAIDAKYGAHP